MWLNLLIKKIDSPLLMLSSAIVLLYSNSSVITFYFDYFDLIIGSQGVVKIVQKNPVYPSPSFLQWLHLT